MDISIIQDTFFCRDTFQGDTDISIIIIIQDTYLLSYNTPEVYIQDTSIGQGSIGGGGREASPQRF